MAFSRPFGMEGLRSLARVPGRGWDQTRSAGRLVPHGLLLGREVALHHHGDEVGEWHLGLPAEHPPRLGGVTDEQVDLGRPQKAGIVADHVLSVIEPESGEGYLAELPD